MEVRKVSALLAMSILFSFFVSSEMKASDSHQTKNQKRPRMDIGFCIDTTGSMQAELDIVKEKVKELVASLSSGKPTPDVRVAMVAYRDRGDSYVTKKYPFTDDIDKFVNDITDLKAKGGGDSPEALNQALHAAVSDLKWDKSNKTAKMLFLIGDAGPKKYEQDFSWEAESKKAIANGIQINTIGCDGLERFPGDKGMGVFKKIAKLADGQFELLAYKREVTAQDGSTRTLIKAGGSSYEIESSASESEWKKGAASLMASGKAKLVKPKTRAFSRHSFSRGTLGLDASSAADMAPEGYGASIKVDRKASNLDSILIRAAKKKASKDLHIKYEE